VREKKVSEIGERGKRERNEKGVREEKGGREMLCVCVLCVCVCVCVCVCKRERETNEKGIRGAVITQILLSLIWKRQEKKEMI